MTTRCRRCNTPIQEHTRWCDDCFYVGIDEVYEEYQSMLAEGYRRIDAAVRSGWQDPIEAGAYIEDE
ncbi:hypothetical protein [Vibrio scophthalmi]|uniref:Uncharacterized protein n=1 Tax=Vibrio scophthalmi LMG 19158 TaxID=870967 RepID=F9RQM4_9VIBR|nr:hypothetical protein [Vibrio scophthalmi]EGU33955.1 hypothetical protein VIS19158_10879 [Vibrio scophthalmi LMG 19158]